MEKNFKLIGTLPKETKIYCGHEYTLSNYSFCEFIEPENKELMERIQIAKKMLTEGKKGALFVARLRWQKYEKIEKATIPSTIGVEMDTNVFMRTHLLKERVEKLVGEKGKVEDENEVMKWLRQMKNEKWHV